MEPTAPIDPSLRIASVHLDVGDLDRSSDFYERVLGLPLISRESGRALLGLDAQSPALALNAIENPTLASPHSTGLFHVAWLHPSRAALADTVRRIASARWPIDGAADHGVSEALYLSDPDGLGIEIYADRPRERWQRPADGHGVRIVTLALDTDDLLAQSSSDPGTTVAAGTSIGHVHLKVADVPRAFGFYHDVLGLEEQAQLPSAAFLSAGGYHHHIGLNSWQSAGAEPAPQAAPHLRAIELELADAGAIDTLRQNVAGGRTPGSPDVQVQSDDEQALSVQDPDGNLLRFAAVSA